MCTLQWRQIRSTVVSFSNPVALHRLGTRKVAQSECAIIHSRSKFTNGLASLYLKQACSGNETAHSIMAGQEWLLTLLSLPSEVVEEIVLSPVLSLKDVCALSRVNWQLYHIVGRLWGRMATTRLARQ